MDETHELTLETVKERAVRGVVVLTGRTFILSVISFVAIALLGSFFETTAELGVFWVVSAVVNFLAYFSDVGLAAALIQKKEIVTDDDLKTTFTIQQILVVTLVALLFLATPYILAFYKLGDEAKYLIYALGLSFVLSSLKTIPSTLLERRLEFGKLVIPQVLENLVYYLVALFLAWKGWGLTSFTVAVLIRGFVGLGAIYAIEPWVPGIAFSRTSLKKLLTFGVPYQVNTFIALLKDDGMTLVLGGILGVGGIGILGWAQKWGYAPLRFFMDHVTKVTFPAFARMQEEPEHLARAVTRSIFFVSFLVFPTIIGLVIVSPILVAIVPRYEKWEPAIIPLGLIAVNTVFAAVTTPLTNLLSAVGKIKTVSKLMVMWTVLTWLFVPFLGLKYGVTGAALGYSLVGVSSLVAIFIAKRHINFSLVDSAVKPAIATFAMAVVLLVLKNFLPVSFYGVVFLVGVGMVTYLASSYVIVGSSLLTDARVSASALFGKKGKE